jgi:RNA-binding protein
MQELTGTQRKYLRGLAHHLKPVVHVGRHGVTAPVLQEVEDALENHELIKVKLVDPQGRKKELSQELSEGSGAAWVGLVGNIVTLYRQHPDPDKRQVELSA